MKKSYLYLLCVLFLLVVVKDSFAIGIGPPSVELDFQPALNKDLTFMVLNNIAVPIRADLYVKGYLKDYITLEKDYIDLNPGESANFKVYVRLPSQIDVPGPHDTRIGALESQKTAQAGTVGAKAGVEAKLIINVPYEGKYIKADFEAADIKIGERVNFAIALSNMGKEDIANVRASIEIYDSDNKKIAIVETNSVELKIDEKKELRAEWLSEGFGAGIYKALAKINYDENIKEIQTSFKIGDVLIEILDVSISKFKKGEIAQISILIQSKWNEPIDDVFANIELYKDSELVDTIATNHITINPWANSTIDAYWSTVNIAASNYLAKTTLNYAGQTTYKEFNIEVKGKGLGGIGTIIVIISIPIIFFILWWIFWASKK